MAAIAPLVLKDGAAVNHTFTPVEVSAGVAKYQDVSSGIAISFPTVTTSLRLPSKKAPSAKAVMRITVPVTHIMAPSVVPTKDFDMLANIDVIMPEKATPAQRADLAAYVSNLLASAPVQSMLKDLITTW